MATTLRLLSWPDYVDPATLEQFSNEFDIRIAVETVPSAPEMMERMRMSPAPDLLCPPEYLVRELSAAGLLHKLDHHQLSNLEYVDAQFLKGRPHDPQGNVSVVKDWGTTGFMYRSDLVEERPQSWDEFWNLAEKYTGQVTVLDSPGEVIGAALKKNGFSYNNADEQPLAIARKDLLRLKETLHSFETGYRPLLQSGQARLSLGWNGDAVALAAGGLPINYVIPLEGTQIWEDDWAIAANTENPEAAHSFLNFCLRPKVAAQEARYTRYATGNRGALELLDETMRGDPSVYPPKELLEKLERGIPLDPEGAERRASLWKDIRA